MTDAHVARGDDREGLRARLEAIEDQPLDARAPAYQQAHDALQAELEGGESRA